MRLDKWLCAARFFKTRALASRACELGRVQTNGAASKASREVRLGDILRVKTEGATYELEVLALSETRGPAVVAQTLYHETEESRAMRVKAAEERKAMAQFERTPVGKPSKRDRRVADRMRGRV